VNTARLPVAIGLVLAPQLAIAQGHDMPEDYARRLVAAALEQTRSSVVYDGSYRRIGYPGGDVPANIGVCTDVVIRAYRKVGVDLQVEVHEDMEAGLHGVSPNLALNATRFKHRSSASAQPADLPAARRGTADRVAGSVCLSLRRSRYLDASGQPPPYRHRCERSLSRWHTPGRSQHRSRARARRHPLLELERKETRWFPAGYLGGRT
jgi:hypothetical protein